MKATRVRFRKEDPTKKKPAKTMLKDMIIDEVSLVGAGANQHAKVSMFKSAPGRDPKVLKESFDEVMLAIPLREELREVIRVVYQHNDALLESLWSIIDDDVIADKKAAMTQSILQFLLSLSNMTGQELNKEEIQKLVDDDATKSNNQNPTPEELQMKKELSYYQLVAKMNDEQKTAFLLLKEEDQEMLVKMEKQDEAIAEIQKSVPEPKKEPVVKKDPVDEDSFDMNGTPVLKSVVGDASFLIIKALHADSVVNKAELSKQIGLRVAKELEDEAVALFPNLPGTPVEKGKVLKAIKDLPEELQKSQIAMLKAGNDNMSELFKEKGATGQTDEDGPAAELDKLSKAFAKENSMTFEKAYCAVCETTEGKELYGKLFN